MIFCAIDWKHKFDIVSLPLAMMLHNIEVRLDVGKCVWVCVEYEKEPKSNLL